MTDGKDLRDEGMQLALGAGDLPPWPERARDALVELAATRYPFTSEDLIDRVGLPRPDEGGANRQNAVGAVFGGAARSRLIRRVGFQKARRRNRHAGMVSVWVGHDD